MNAYAPRNPVGSAIGPAEVADISAISPRSPTAADDRTSAAIAVARVLCIVGVVYVHAWTGLTGPQLAVSDHTPQGCLRWALAELFGRSAVPLLGMISGWLVVGAAKKRAWPDFLAGKARTILAPMVVWNALGIVLVSGAAYARLLTAPKPDSSWWTINELLCLVSPDDINVQMPFLRDLFVCMVAAPALVRLPVGLLAAIGAGALVWAVSGWSFPLLLRPAILLFFVVGMLARRLDAAKQVAAWPMVSTAAPYLLLAAAKVWFEAADVAAAAHHPMLMAGLDLAMRFAAALFFWSLAWRIAGGRAAGPLLRIEPYAFLLFCVHLILIWLAGPLIGLVTGPLGSPLYPVFLLVQPALVLLATLAIGDLAMRMAPQTAILLSGGRLKATRPTTWR